MTNSVDTSTWDWMDEHTRMYVEGAKCACIDSLNGIDPISGLSLGRTLKAAGEMITASATKYLQQHK